MELYLIRHGIAQERQLEIQDEVRSLTAAGRQKTQKVAKRLAELGLQFELILTSPLVRSQQTAEILLAAGLSSQIITTDALAPEGDIHNWLHWLAQQQFSPESKLALVGHQPDLGQWAEILAWGKATAALVLKKAGIIGLTLPATGLPAGRSQLFWLTPPKFLL